VAIGQSFQQRTWWLYTEIEAIKPESSARDCRLRAKGSSMQKENEEARDPDMLEEYDFSKGMPGKYAKRYAVGSNLVVLEPAVAEVFPDLESVNQALRALAEIIRQRSNNIGA
jgi:hypothetical protein